MRELKILGWIVLLVLGIVMSVLLVFALDSLGRYIPDSFGLLFVCLYLFFAGFFIVLAIQAFVRLTPTKYAFWKAYNNLYKSLFSHNHLKDVDKALNGFQDLIKKIR